MVTLDNSKQYNKLYAFIQNIYMQICHSTIHFNSFVRDRNENSKEHFAVLIFQLSKAFAKEPEQMEIEGRVGNWEGDVNCCVNM